MPQWVELVKQRVPFVTSGPNVARYHLNIKCPFCGDSDPSEHLGIDLRKGYWGCWRDKSHRGKRPHRLLCRLFGWTLAEAKAFLGEDAVVDRSTLSQVITQLKDGRFQESHSPIVPAAVSFPPEIRPLVKKPITGNFTRYLEERGLPYPQQWAAYRLHYALLGKWAQRIVFPVADLAGQLRTWTGRAIGSSSTLRYRSASEEDGAAVISDYIFNVDGLNRSGGGRLLCVVEGPFDAMCLDTAGEPLGVRATCVFGAGVSRAQHRLLSTIASGFDDVCIALDEANLAGTLREWSALADLHPIPRSPWRKDFGEMTGRELTAWCQEAVSIV